MTAATILQYFLFIRTLSHWRLFFLLVNSTTNKRAILLTTTAKQQETEKDRYTVVAYFGYVHMYLLV
jgi:hypothetical protein